MKIARRQFLHLAAGAAFLPALSVPFSALAQPATKAVPGGIFRCAREPHLKSEDASFPTAIIFTNRTRDNISLFWLDYRGERVAYKTLRSGEAYTQRTYISHPWVIVGPHGACRKIVLPGSTTRTVTIE